MTATVTATATATATGGMSQQAQPLCSGRVGVEFESGAVNDGTDLEGWWG